MIDGGRQEGYTVHEGKFNEGKGMLGRNAGAPDEEKMMSSQYGHQTPPRGQGLVARVVVQAGAPGSRSSIIRGLALR